MIQQEVIIHILLLLLCILINPEIINGKEIHSEYMNKKQDLLPALSLLHWQDHSFNP